MFPVHKVALCPAAVTDEKPSLNQRQPGGESGVTEFQIKDVQQ